MDLGKPLLQWLFQQQRTQESIRIMSKISKPDGSVNRHLQILYHLRRSSEPVMLIVPCLQTVVFGVGLYILLVDHFTGFLLEYRRVPSDRHLQYPFLRIHLLLVHLVHDEKVGQCLVAHDHVSPRRKESLVVILDHTLVLAVVRRLGVPPNVPRVKRFRVPSVLHPVDPTIPYRVILKQSIPLLPVLLKLWYLLLRLFSREVST